MWWSQRLFHLSVVFWCLLLLLILFFFFSWCLSWHVIFCWKLVIVLSDRGWRGLYCEDLCYCATSCSVSNVCCQKLQIPSVPFFCLSSYLWTSLSTSPQRESTSSSSFNSNLLVFYWNPVEVMIWCRRKASYLYII